MLAVLRIVAVFPIHCAVRVPQTYSRFVNNVKAVCQVKFCEGDCFMKKACKLAVAKNAVALFFALWVFAMPLIPTGTFAIFQIGNLVGIAEIFAKPEIGTILTGILIVPQIVLLLVVLIISIKNLVLTAKSAKNPENANAVKLRKSCKTGTVVALFILYVLCYWAVALGYLPLHFFNVIAYIVLLGAFIATIVLGKKANKAISKALAEQKPLQNTQPSTEESAQ